MACPSLSSCSQKKCTDNEKMSRNKYHRGFKNGYEKGHREGFEKGHEEGYKLGIKEGEKIKPDETYETHPLAKVRI